MKFSIRSFRWTDFLLPLQSGHGSIRKPPHFWQTLVTERDWKQEQKNKYQNIKIYLNLTERDWKQKHQLQNRFKLIDFMHFWQTLVTERDWKQKQNQKYQLQYKFKLGSWLCALLKTLVTERDWEQK